MIKIYGSAATEMVATVANEVVRSIYVTRFASPFWLSVWKIVREKNGGSGGNSNNCCTLNSPFLIVVASLLLLFSLSIAAFLFRFNFVEVWKGESRCWQGSGIVCNAQTHISNLTIFLKSFVVVSTALSWTPYILLWTNAFWNVTMRTILEFTLLFACSPPNVLIRHTYKTVNIRAPVRFHQFQSRTSICDSMCTQTHTFNFN